MQGAPRSNDKNFFWSSPVFGWKILRKCQSVRAQLNVNPVRAITWFAGITIICAFFNNNSPPSRQFLCNKILLKKNSYSIRRMLIKQIFELRGPGPPGCTCTPATGCFHDKTRISKENIRLDCYLLLKYCRRQCTLLSPTRAKSLTKFNAKMQDFKRSLDLNC